MKKTLLLAGLFGACISINAQESFKYGFEDGEVFGRIYEDDIFDDDPTPQGRWQTALFTDIGEDETIQSEWYLPIPEEGGSAFESEELSRSGLKCMYIKNNVGKCPWENQAALDNLIFNDMTSYQFTFCVKAAVTGDSAWGENFATKIKVITVKGYLWGNQALKTAEGVN